MPTDSPTAKSYPTEEQYDRWKARADEFNMSVSEFIAAMTEAGMKKFDVTVEPDETVEEIREERDDMREKLARCREELTECEERLHGTETAALEDYVMHNAEATFDEIVAHLRATVPIRASQHVDRLEGKTIRVNDNGLYEPIDGGEGQ